jgi:hypothetical protein
MDIAEVCVGEGGGVKGRSMDEELHVCKGTIS